MTNNVPGDRKYSGSHIYKKSLSEWSLDVIGQKLIKKHMHLIVPGTSKYYEIKNKTDEDLENEGGSRKSLS